MVRRKKIRKLVNVVHGNWTGSGKHNVTVINGSRSRTTSHTSWQAAKSKGRKEAKRIGLAIGRITVKTSRGTISGV